VLALRWPSATASVYLAAIAGVALIVAQQRTVWVAAIAVGLIGFAAWSKRRLREAESVVFGATGLVILAIPAAVWLLSRSSTIRLSVAETTQSQSTLQWRITSWRELIASHHSTANLVIGEPAGTSWSRAVFGGATTDVSAHSSFVEALLRFGIPGLVLFVCLMYVLFRKRRRIAHVTALTPNVVGLLLITQLLFAMTYTLSAVQGLMIGIFVSSLVWDWEPAPETMSEPERLAPRGHATALPT
jgi:O-antigen ligase